MKPFRLYECCPDGSLVDTNQLIMCNETKVYNQAGGTVVKDIFDKYGFTQYVDYYSVVSSNDRDITVLYNNNKTWVLKIESENEGEVQ